MKLLSIIIPTFNRVRLIKNLVEALAGVSEKPELEIIIVDDCSKPSIQGELRLISGDYPSITFLFLSENTGGAGARNRGAELSNSKWIWFLDDDDYIDSGKVSLVLKRLEKIDNTTNLVFLSANFINGKRNRVCIPNGKEIFKRFSRYGSEINTSCVIFDFVLFEKIGGWDSTFVAGQDTDILLRASELTDAYVFPDIYVDVINHGGERITTNPKKQLKAKYQFVVKNYKRLHFFRLARYVVSLIIAYPYVRRLIKK